MFDKGHPVRIVSKIRNNRLTVLWEDSGKKLDDFLQTIGISKGTWYELVSLKMYPSENLAKRISDKTGCGMEELFPSALRSISKTVCVQSVPEHELLRLSEARHIALPAPQLDDLIQAETSEIMDKILHRLKPREEFVIRMAFGIGDANKQTLCEIAERLNLSRNRISQIYAKALFKLRRDAARTLGGEEMNLLMNAIGNQPRY